MGAQGLWGFRPEYLLGWPIAEAQTLDCPSRDPGRTAFDKVIQVNADLEKAGREDADLNNGWTALNDAVAGADDLRAGRPDKIFS